MYVNIVHIFSYFTHILVLYTISQYFTKAQELLIYEQEVKRLDFKNKLQNRVRDNAPV